MAQINPAPRTRADRIAYLRLYGVGATVARALASRQRFIGTTPRGSPVFGSADDTARSVGGLWAVDTHTTPEGWYTASVLWSKPSGFDQGSRGGAGGGIRAWYDSDNASAVPYTYGPIRGYYVI